MASIAYVTVRRLFEWKDNDFVLVRTDVNIPEYPDNIRDVVLDYLCLKVMAIEKSTQVDNRLNEICLNGDIYTLDYVNYLNLQHVFFNMEYAVKLEIIEHSDKAKVNVTSLSMDDTVHEYVFDMTKNDSQWHIEDISYNGVKE